MRRYTDGSRDVVDLLTLDPANVSGSGHHGVGHQLHCSHLPRHYWYCAIVLVAFVWVLRPKTDISCQHANTCGSIDWGGIEQ